MEYIDEFLNLEFCRNFITVSEIRPRNKKNNNNRNDDDDGDNKMKIMMITQGKMLTNAAISFLIAVHGLYEDFSTQSWTHRKFFRI